MSSEYETLSWAVDDAGVATLVLDRPDALNSFTVAMARELESFFRIDAMHDEVRAVVVTGAGRGFCAGMDLSAEGNVFGLDETLSPTPADLRDRLDDPEIAEGVRDTGGKVTLAIHELPDPQKDVLEKAEQLCTYIRKRAGPDGSLACVESGKATDGQSGPIRYLARKVASKMNQAGRLAPSSA